MGQIFFPKETCIVGRREYKTSLPAVSTSMRRGSTHSDRGLNAKHALNIQIQMRENECFILKKS